jgi:hypothetical protein
MARNKEKAAATYAKWYAANKERKRASHAVWLAANKEKVAATAAKWRADKREQLRAESAVRRANTPEKVWPAVVTWENKNAENVVKKYKGSTKLREANRKSCRAYRAKNIEARRKIDREYASSIREHRLETHREWVSKNKEYVAAYMREWRKTAHVTKCRKGDKRTTRNTPPWASQFLIGEIYALARLRTKVTGFPWEVDHIIPLNGKTVCGLHVENNLRVIERQHNRVKGNLHAN